MQTTVIGRCLKEINAVAVIVGFLTCSSLVVQGQQRKDMKMFLSSDSASFVQFLFTNQTWVRYAENNPGSAVAGSNAYQMEDKTFDIGLRRTRMQFVGKINRRLFIYTQFGLNNFNYISSRKSGFFIHDALGEINLNKAVSFGAGLTAWTGFSRYSSPGVASIMGLDAPLFLQATNDANDQFLRKLSLYAKGNLHQINYRLVVSKPMDFVYSTLYKKNNISADAMLAPTPPKPQFSGYLSYQFLDLESDMTPYQVGTYLGKKKVFNVGGGWQYQPDATWYTRTKADQTDTLFHDMLLASLDFYFDAPLNKEHGDAISFYAVAAHYDFGPGYIRNIGVMNTTDSLKATSSTFNGTGVNFPMIGTGNSAYVQVGYLTRRLSNKETSARLMPYAAVQYSIYEKLADPMIFADLGCSLYLDDSRSKLTLGIQNRPIYKTSATDPKSIKLDHRLNSFILQYQVSF